MCLNFKPLSMEYMTRPNYTSNKMSLPKRKGIKK